MAHKIQPVLAEEHMVTHKHCRGAENATGYGFVRIADELGFDLRIRNQIQTKQHN